MLILPIELINQLLYEITYFKSNELAVEICSFIRDTAITTSPLCACDVKLEDWVNDEPYIIEQYICLVDLLHLKCIYKYLIRKGTPEDYIIEPLLLGFTVDKIRYLTKYNDYRNSNNNTEDLFSVMSKISKCSSNTYEKWLLKYLSHRELLLTLNKIKNNSRSFIHENEYTSSMLNNSIEELKEHIEDLLT